MKQCMHCKTDIHEHASKCPHCRAWQSRSGVFTKAGDLGIGSLIIAALITWGVVAANEHSQRLFSETPKTVMWMVLAEYPDIHENGQRTESLDSINILNYFAAKDKAESIIAQATTDGVFNIAGCVFVQKSTCERLDVAVKDNGDLFVTKPESIGSLSSSYMFNTLRRNSRGASIFGSKDGWEIKY